eukprot:NODE_2946_length_1059_cov_8.020386_g2812_i0.p1 GENE.NODE_2946_length_1059_cov_8.020386_g2812_i0~~NODE_2946_length_1059_cov_8.020386_g2812_i0.p1  ORF type:complete len:329 (+),score=69.10 NODE_2946_length_1059_cov_8.020386_g2812_i0:46-1032(+)
MLVSVVYSLTCFLATFVGSMTGFGAGILLMMGWQIFSLLNLPHQLDYVSVVQLGTIVSLVFQLPLGGISIYNGLVPWKDLLCFFPSFAASFYLSSALMLHTDETLLRKLLGMLFILIALQKFCSVAWQWTQPPKDRSPTPMSLLRQVGWFLTGLFSGVSGGLFSVAGPPVIIYIDLIHMPKEQVRALMYCSGIPMLCVRLIQLVVTHKFRPDWVVDASALLIVPVAALLGNKMHHLISQEHCIRCLFALILVSGVSMVMDLRGGGVWALVFSGVVGGSLLGMFGLLVGVTLCRTDQPKYTVLNLREEIEPPKDGTLRIDQSQCVNTDC